MSRKARINLKTQSLKPKSGSRLQKFEPDKKIPKNNEPNKTVIKCECGKEMEFYGVDGNGGSKYCCGNCYEKKIIR